MLNEPARKPSTTIKVATETAEDINTLFGKLVEGNSHAAKQIAKKASWNQKITAILNDYKKIEEKKGKITFVLRTDSKQCPKCGATQYLCHDGKKSYYKCSKCGNEEIEGEGRSEP